MLRDVTRQSSLIAALCLFEALASFACSDDAEGPEDDAAHDADAAQASVDASIQDAGRPDAAPNDASGVRDASDSGGAADAQIEDAGGIGDAGMRSEGCGKTESGSGEFERRSAQVGGRERSYHVWVPSSYQASRAYPLVFRWHGSGGDGLSGGMGIEFAVQDDAIVVGADGLEQVWNESTEANDLLLFDAMYQQLGRDYCIDLKRVFSYGFSAGGGMTNVLSCKRGDKLRASAAVAGQIWGDQSGCNTPVAAWFLHDRDDDAVLVAEGRKARDVALSRNDCSSATSPLAGGCVSYNGCRAGFPVIWCETQGLGHNIAGDSAPAQVWAFFSGLP
jgi:poly(3-hydroxybutyrate) depolymerase